MFNFIDIGERAGSGIPNIFRVWKEQKWSEPVITEEYNPDRTTLSLPTVKSDDKKVTITSQNPKQLFKRIWSSIIWQIIFTEQSAIFPIYSELNQHVQRR